MGRSTIYHGLPAFVPTYLGERNAVVDGRDQPIERPLTEDWRHEPGSAKNARADQWQDNRHFESL